VGCSDDFIILGWNISPGVRQRFLSFFLQLRGTTTALSRKFLHDLTTARHFKFFLISVIRIFTTKIEKFQLRGNNSVCSGAFQFLRDRVRAQLRGNVGVRIVLYYRIQPFSLFSFCLPQFSLLSWFVSFSFFLSYFSTLLQNSIIQVKGKDAVNQQNT
jgi:hypothetical protein